MKYLIAILIFLLLSELVFAQFSPHKALVDDMVTIRHNNAVEVDEIANDIDDATPITSVFIVSHSSSINKAVASSGGMKITYTCNTIGDFNRAYNIRDNAGKEAQYPAILRVTCTENTCFGTKSTNTTVCSSRGKCTGTDQCSCSFGYKGTNCSDCLTYDACGICNGPSFVCKKTLVNDNFSLLHYQTKVLDLLSNDTIYNKYAPVTDIVLTNNTLISVFVTQRTNLSFTCDDVGDYYIAYNVKDSSDGVADKDAIVNVKCIPSTCFGILSSNSSVCTGRGYCVGLDTCSCRYGYIGSNCQYCATYDRCGVCNGDSSTCPDPDNNPDPLPTQGLEIQQYVDCGIRTLPDSELTQQERAKAVSIIEITTKAAYLPGITGLTNNVTCITGTKAQYLNGMITYITSEDSTYSQVTKMAVYKLRTTVNDLVECFGAQVVSAQKLAVTATVDIYNKRTSNEYNDALDAWAKARNITYSDPSLVYKDKCTYAITSLSYGTSSVAFNPGNLGYSVSHLTTRYDEVIDKIESVIQICVNYPTGTTPHEWLSFNSSVLVSSEDVHTPLTLGYYDKNCSTLYDTKCCQTFSLMSDLPAGNCIQRRDANTFAINVVGPNSIDQTGIAVVTDISICVDRGPTDIFVDKPPTASLILYQEKYLQTPATVYVQGTRAYGALRLNGLTTTQCNMYQMTINSLRICCGNCANQKIIYTYDSSTGTKYDGGEEYQTTVYDRSGSSVETTCTSKQYFDFIARILVDNTTSCTLYSDWLITYTANGATANIRGTTAHHLIESTSGVYTNSSTAQFSVVCPTGQIYSGGVCIAQIKESNNAVLIIAIVAASLLGVGSCIGCCFFLLGADRDRDREENKYKKKY